MIDRLFDGYVTTRQRALAGEGGVQCVDDRLYLHVPVVSAAATAALIGAGIPPTQPADLAKPANTIVVGGGDELGIAEEG
jgi:hypothetical protein